MLVSSLTSLFFISQVTAAVATVPLFSRDSPDALLPRQNRGPLPTPVGCESTCGTGILNQLNICISTACLCSEDNAKLLEGCIECMVGLAPSKENIDIGQGVLDKFSNSCKVSSLPALTVTAAPADTTAAPGSVKFPTIPSVITVEPPPSQNSAAASSGAKADGGASPSNPNPSPTQSSTKDNSAAGLGGVSGILTAMSLVGGVLGMFGL
ncbi:hypothetical protein BDZ94DRAFT_765489 [Collybia nuda]|uniref:Extracellular membrane protein CFEM domain-containing protein n=1 Tax=Collybia nuda TaxID=64659 RepID=A0A9P5XR10_9AGAR|nr:hypothetical protein BDZ94DRAFT_765489 [Collybia nuda]